MIKERSWLAWLGVILLLLPWMLNEESEWLWYGAQVLVLLSLHRVFICLFFLGLGVLCAMLYSTMHGALPLETVEQMEVEMTLYAAITCLSALDLFLRRPTRP